MYELNEEDEALAKLLASQQKSSMQPQKPKSGGAGSFLMGLLPGGSLIDKGIRGEQITGGDIASEALLTALPFGIGKLARGAGSLLKGGKAVAEAGKTGSSAAKILSSVQETPGMARSMLRQSTIAPNSTLKTATEQNRLIDTVRSLPNMRGSASRKFQNVEGEIGRMTDEVDSLLKGVDKRLPVADFQKKVGKVRDGIVDPTEARRFEGEYNTMIGKAFKDKAPDELSPTDVNSIRRAINGQMSGVFKKIDAGTQLTDKDEALLKLRDVMSSTLEEMSPDSVSGNVKDINRKVATLMSGIPEFKRASEENLQLLGTRIPFVSQKLPQMWQAGTDIAGRTLASTSGKFLLPQAGVRLGADALGLRSPESADAQSGATALPGSPNGDAASILGMAGSGKQGGGSTSPDSQSLYSKESAAQDIQRDLQETGGENMEKYMKLYEFLNPDAKLTAAQQKQAAGLTQSNAILDELQGGLGEIGGGRGVSAYLTQLGNMLSGGAIDPSLATYDALRGGITSKLARSLGEVGTLTDQDIQRALTLIPSSTDAPEASSMKMSQLRDLINAANGSSGSSTPDPAALLAALQQSGY